MIEHGIMTAHGACFPGLGLRQRVLREGHNFTQSGLAEASGVHRPEISKWEGGFALQRFLIHADALARVLGPEVLEIAELTRLSLRAFELERRLLDAKVTHAVLSIVGRCLEAKASPDDIMAAVSLSAVCAELGEEEPMMAVEAVPMRAAIHRALASLPALLKLGG